MAEEEGPHTLKAKTVDEVDMEKYTENEGSENPYYRKYGVKKKSYFSRSKSNVFDSEEEAGNVTSNHEVDGESAARPARPSCAADEPAGEAHPAE